MQRRNHSSPGRRFLRFVGILVLASVASGCAGFMYNRLDTLAAWYAGGLVSLDDQQRADLQSWLTQTLQWHRESELKRYAQFLRELSSEVAQPATRTVYQQALDRAKGFVADFTGQAAPEAARLLLALSPAQVEELLANLEHKAEERSEDHIEEMERGTWHAKRVKRVERQLKRWTGAVTDEQKGLIREMTKPLQPTAQDWLESQRRWRASLRDALSTRESPEAAQRRIAQLLREPDNQWSPQYKAKEANNREQTLALLAALDVSLTPAQRQKMQRELLAMAERLEALTEE